MPVLVNTTVQTFVEAIQDVTCAVMDTQPAVTLEEVMVMKEVVVTTAVVMLIDVVVAISVVVSVVVLGESDPVAKRVAKIKAAPATIPTMSKAAPAIWLDALLRMGGTLQSDHSKR